MIGRIAAIVCGTAALLFVLNVVLITVEAPVYFRPFYWTDLLVDFARVLAARAGDVVGRVYVHVASVLHHFVEKLGPAVRESFGDALKFATLGVVMVLDFSSHLLQTLRDSQAYGYVVNPYVLVIISTLAVLVLFAVLIERFRPPWFLEPKDVVAQAAVPAALTPRGTRVR